MISLIALFYMKVCLKKMFMTTLLQLLIDAGWIIMPARVNHGWLEVDTVEDLKLYEKLSAEGKLDNFWKVYG